jgi:hypothetical protein
MIKQMSQKKEKALRRAVKKNRPEMVGSKPFVRAIKAKLREKGLYA